MGLPRPETEIPQGTRLLDRYVVHDRFDGGGMASIYRAWDERLERVVCVKLLRTTMAEGSGSTGNTAVYRSTYTHFLKEALSLSKLQHPHTLRIYDFGFYGDPALPLEERSPFHVSEFLSGGNLDTRVREGGPVGPAVAIDVVEKIAGALAEAHSHGIVHRDIKPSNILFAEVSGTFVPKLADFGIARSAAPIGSGGDTMANLTLCSPRWAAPEQLANAGEGPSTDVYALGLVLHFMLVGAPLFDVPRIRDTFGPRLADDGWVSGLVRRAGLGPAVEPLLLRCLRTNPAARFQDAPSFASAARAALMHVPAPSSSGRPVAPRSSPASSPGSLAPLEARVRFVETTERADLAFVGPKGESRVRLTFQPTNGRVNVKSLSGFVRREGARPSAALLVEEDSAFQLVAADQSVHLTASLSFGQRTAEGTVFLVDGQPVLVPSSRASQAVALFVADTREVVVLARK